MNISFFLYILYFQLFLIFIYFLFKIKFINSQYSKLENVVYEKIFPTININEINKFPILRILFSLILVVKNYKILYYLSNFESFQTYLYTYCDLTLSILLLFGLFSQYILIYFIFFSFQIGEFYLGTVTLGHDIGAMVAIILFLTNSGKKLSFDNFLIKKFNQKIFLYFDYFESPKNISMIKFSSIIAYSSLCIYSVSLHINEEAWTSGNAAIELLSSSYMSLHYEFFRKVFENFPISIILAKFSMWVMMIWYVTIIPSLFIKGFLLKFTIIWGFLFFILSTFFLQLGYLGYIEFILWFAIFWNKLFIKNNKKIKIFYDDKCNLCDKTIKFLTFTDIFGLINFLPASKSLKEAAIYNIEYKEIMENIYCITKDKKILYGYNFYYYICQRLVLLWILLPIMFIGKFIIGKIIYNFIAKRRRELFGLCTIPTKKNNYLINAKYTNQGENFSKSIITSHILSSFFFLMLCIFFAIHPKFNLRSIDTNKIGKVFSVFGVNDINVFNKTDLKMSERWFTIFSLDNNELIPFLGKSGERKKYHSSDRIYFGISSIIRRSMIGSQTCFFKKKEKVMDYYVNYLISIYISQNKKLSNIKKLRFRYDEFYQKNPKYEDINKKKLIINQIEKVCSVNILIEK